MKIPHPFIPMTQCSADANAVWPVKAKKATSEAVIFYIIDANLYITNVVICCSNLEYAGSIGCSPCIQ